MYLAVISNYVWFNGGVNHVESESPVGISEIMRAYKIPLLLGVASACAIGASLFLLTKSTQSTSPIQFSSDSASGSGVLEAHELKVDIEGAVVHPGLYSLPGGSRVEDAITAAGGLTSVVDEALFARTINRAMKLVDGAKLFIPSDETGESSTITNANPTDSQSIQVSINSASESQLDTLPGVGPVTAKKIIDNRPYQTLEELVSKKAVGSSVFENIKSFISL